MTNRIPPVSKQTGPDRLAAQRALVQKPDLTPYEQGQLAALRIQPCTPPDGLSDEDDGAWCSGWSDYGQED